MLIKGRRVQLEQFGCGQEDEIGGSGHISAIWSKHQHKPLPLFLLFLGLSFHSEGLCKNRLRLNPRCSC